MVTTLGANLSPAEGYNQGDAPQGHTLAPATGGMESRRASNQSKELSEMDLPEPSYNTSRSTFLANASNPTITTSNGLLSADNLDSSPFVRSIPSSPYLGPTSTSGSVSPNLSGLSGPRFGSDESDEIARRLEELELPDPEAVREDSEHAKREREQAARDLAEVMDNMELPEPEWVVRANMRAEGIKTPEPFTQDEGQVLSRSESLKLSRSGTVKASDYRQRRADKAAAAAAADGTAEEAESAKEE